MEIKFHIGHKCNLKCKYCHVDQTVNDINYDHLLDLEIEKCKKNNIIIDKLLITGGETSLYKDRVYKILDKYQDLIKITVVTNGSDIDFCRKVNSYKNVILTISWDGPNNERGFDSFETIKTIISEFPNKIPTISHVISNTNYKTFFRDMCSIHNINPTLELTNHIETRLVRQSDSYYKIDFKEIFKQFELTIEKFPLLNIFQRNQSKTCPHTHCEEVVIDIDNNEVKHGCLKYVYHDWKACDFYNDLCLKCKIDTCFVCTPALAGMKLETTTREPNSKYINNDFCRLQRILHNVIIKYNRKVFLMSKLLSYNHFELILSDGCNLACKYCYQGDNKKFNVLTKETIESFVNFLKIYFNHNKFYPSITLFGGEPINEYTYKSINYLLDLFEKENIKTKIDIISNGYSLNNNLKDTYKRLIQHGLLSVQISLDGCREAHNSSRINKNNIGTFDNVLNTIQWLRNEFPNLHISTQSVIDYPTVKYLSKSIMFLEKLRINHIIDSYSTRLQRVQVDYPSTKLAREFLIGFKEIVELYKSGQISKYALRSVFNLEKFYCDCNAYKHSDSCSMIKKFIAIDCHGDIIPCNACLSIANYQKTYSIGSILNNIKAYENIYKIYDQFDVDERRRCNELTCEGCKSIETCYSCRITNIQLNKNMNIISPLYCNMVKSRYRILEDNILDDIKTLKVLTNEERQELLEDIKQIQLTMNKLSGNELSELCQLLLFLKDRLL